MKIIKRDIFENINNDVENILNFSKETLDKYKNGPSTLRPPNLEEDVVFKEKKDQSYVTNIDLEAEELGINYWLSRYPWAGVLSEERGFIPCKSKNIQCYGIFDMVDGTSSLFHTNFWLLGATFSAIFRKLITEGENKGKWTDWVIIAGGARMLILDRIAYIHYKNPKPQLIINNQIVQNMNENRPLFMHRILFKKDVAHFKSNLIFELAQPNEFSLPEKDRKGKLKGLFLGMDRFGGGISASFVQLWSGVYASILLPAREKGMSPWDWQILYAISIQFDYVMFSINSDETREWKKQNFEETFIEFENKVSLEFIPFPKPVLIIHKNRIEELKSWFLFRSTEDETLTEDQRMVGVKTMGVKHEENNPLRNKKL